MKKFHSIAKIFSLLALFFIFAGCDAWHESKHTKNEPRKSDLVGVYKPDSKTQKLILNDGGYPLADYRIELKADDTIELLNMPDWWNDAAGKSYKKLVSTNGVWHTEKVDSDWQIVWEHDKTIDVGLHLANQKPPYEIEIYVGDPDSGCLMTFERAK